MTDIRTNAQADVRFLFPLSQKRVGAFQQRKRAGKNKDTMPLAKSASDNTNVDLPQPVQNLVMPVVTWAANNLTLPGVLDAPVAASESPGSGTNGAGGAGNGHGTTAWERRGC